MKYYSHVLEFPNIPPFDQEKQRWSSFLGEFVAPFVQGRDPNHFLYWCSYYGATANFRIYTDQYEELRSDLESRLESLKLRDTGAEKDETLVSDLAKTRFIGPDTKSNPEQRALLILKSLQGVCNLLIDSLVHDSDRYWRFESNGDKAQNPIGNHFFSITHLYHNLSQSQAQIALYSVGRQVGALSYYYYQDALQKGVLPIGHQLIEQVSLDL